MRTVIVVRYSYGSRTGVVQKSYGSCTGVVREYDQFATDQSYTNLFTATAAAAAVLTRRATKYVHDGVTAVTGNS